jgi:hypothetical protein
LDVLNEHKKLKSLPYRYPISSGFPIGNCRRVISSANPVGYKPIFQLVVIFI